MMAMRKSGGVPENLGFVGIWKATSQNMLRDTSNDKKDRTPVPTLESLRALATIVRAIKARIRDLRTPGGHASDPRGGSLADKGTEIMGEACGENSEEQK